jgi:hypothetical protein
VAAFKFSERSSLLPPLLAKELPAVSTQIINVRRIRRTNCDPVASEKECTPDRISNTDDCVNCNPDYDIADETIYECAVDSESDMEQDNSIEDPESPEQRIVNGATIVPRLIRPT